MYRYYNFSFFFFLFIFLIYIHYTSTGPDLISTINQSRNLNTAFQTPNYTPEPTITQPANTFADDDIDIDQLAAIEAQFTDNSSKRPLHSDFANPEKKLKTDLVNKPEDYPDDNDLLFEEDEEYLREIEAEIDVKENRLHIVENTGLTRVSAEPFVYIKQLQEMSERDRTGQVFKVKGQVMTLLSKLSVSKDGWSLKCTIVDGTGRLDVDFTSDVLSKLVGVTPQEMNAMKKQMQAKPELKDKVVSVSNKVYVFFILPSCPTYVIITRLLINLY